MKKKNHGAQNIRLSAIADARCFRTEVARETKITTTEVLHGGFEVSIFLKAAAAAAETIFSLLVFSLTPKILLSWISVVSKLHLAFGLSSRLSLYLVQSVENYNNHAQMFVFVYLLSHGVIKLVLVYNLWKKRLWAYPAAIAIFMLFGLYQVFRWTDTHSGLLVFLTALDAIVIFLTIVEYRRLEATDGFQI